MVDETEELGVSKSLIIHQLLSMVDSIQSTFPEEKVLREFTNPIKIKSQHIGKYYFILEIGKINGIK